MVENLVADMFGDVGGLGLDLVEVSLMRDLLIDGGQEFLDAYWTDTEQSDSHKDPARLAGRWAAKEAVMKCLGAGVGEIDPIDVEIITLPSGAPTVVLRARAAEVAKAQTLADCLVSITHEDGWAAAVAIARRQTLSSSPNPSREGSSVPRDPDV
jgi:holo-[acyl-carrier protein] synthase